jgi:ABC-type tungstate transport system substrate-binding protein
LRIQIQMGSTSKEYLLIPGGVLVGLALYYALPEHRAGVLYAVSVFLLGSIVLILPFIPLVRRLMDSVPQGQRDTWVCGVLPPSEVAVCGWARHGLHCCCFCSKPLLGPGWV